MEENKDKKTENSGKLQLKKTFNVGQIKQSFSHGRTRSVSVEVKKKRVLRSLDEKNDLTKEVFKEDNGLEKTSNKEKLDNQKGLRTNKSNFEKDSTQKPKIDNKKEKLDQSDKKNLKKFPSNQNDKTNFPSPQNVLKIEGKESLQYLRLLMMRTRKYVLWQRLDEREKKLN